MSNRVALLAASLVASGVLAVGLAAAGIFPVATPAAPAAEPVAATAAAPAPITQIDTVYVAPAPTPAQITIQRIVTSGHGDDESGDD
jgi:hypothetical protein